MTDKSNGNGRLTGRWLAFTLYTDHDQARATFEAKHGYPPASVVRSGPVLLCGPERPGPLAQVVAPRLLTGRQIEMTLEVTR